MSRSKLSIIVGIALLGVTFAAPSGFSLIVNGQVFGKKAAVINGETYVPLSALKALGVTSSQQGTTLTLSSAQTTPGVTPAATPPAPTLAAGGANQITAMQGCLGDTFFNGVWRIKVISLEPTTEPYSAPQVPGWAVRLEVRNGTKKSLAMMNTGIGASSGGGQPTMVLPDGNTLRFFEGDFLKPWSTSLLPGGIMTFTLRFFFPRDTTDAQVQRPAKFIMEINPKIPDYVGVKYAVPDPSLRVRLDCQK